MSAPLPPHDPLPECDCNICAVIERNNLRLALAGISEEMGLPPTIGPAKGDLKRILDQGAAAIEAIRAAPLAVSAEADFDAMTWTFKISPDCEMGGGIYALVWRFPLSKNSPA